MCVHNERSITKCAQVTSPVGFTGEAKALLVTIFYVKTYTLSVADPGFPVGGAMDLVGGGGMDPRGGYVSKILHVKTKESGPVGGRAPGAPP